MVFKHYFLTCFGVSSILFKWNSAKSRFAIKRKPFKFSLKKHYTASIVTLLECLCSVSFYPSIYSIFINEVNTMAAVKIITSFLLYRKRKEQSQHNTINICWQNHVRFLKTRRYFSNKPFCEWLRAAVDRLGDILVLLHCGRFQFKYEE